MWEKTSKKRLNVELYLNIIFLFPNVLIFFLSYIYISNNYFRLSIFFVISFLLISCLYNIIFRNAKYKRYEYLIADKSISVRRGLFYKIEEHILINKIYQYSIFRNPLLDRLELVNIKLETAAGTMIIDYINPIKAQHLITIIDNNTEVRNSDEKNAQIRDFLPDI